MIAVGTLVVLLACTVGFVAGASYARARLVMRAERCVHTAQRMVRMQAEELKKAMTETRELERALVHARRDARRRRQSGNFLTDVATGSHAAFRDLATG